MNIQYIRDTRIANPPNPQEDSRGRGRQQPADFLTKSQPLDHWRTCPRATPPDISDALRVRVCCERLNAFDLRSRVRICTLVRAVKRAFIISNAIRSVTSHYATSPAQLFHPPCPHTSALFPAALFLPLLYLCMPPTHQETSVDKEMTTSLTVALGAHVAVPCFLFFFKHLCQGLCWSVGLFQVLISCDGQAWKLLLCCVSIHALTVKTQLWFNIIHASFVSLHCPHSGQSASVPAFVSSTGEKSHF